MFRKIGALLVLIFIFCSSDLFAYEKEIRSLSASMAENIAKADKKKIAVVDFADLQGNVTELGRFISEEISVDLTTTSKGFEIIDRTHLKTILTEHKLSLSGIVDQKTVKKLGQIAGVDAIVTGSVTPFGDSVRVTCKVIATDTARVIGAAKGDIAKTKAIEELLGKGIETTVSNVPTINSAQQSKPHTKVEVDNFLFEAKQCRIAGKKIICTIAVINNTSNVKDFAVVLGEPGKSILVDDSGNQYSANTGKFGGEVAKSVRFYVGVWRNGVNQQLPPDIPMNIVIEYHDVITPPKTVTVIIDFYTDKWNKAVLRNTPLTR